MSLLKKLKLIFTRFAGNTLPIESGKKKYGNNGEDFLNENLKELLPECQIKRNVFIKTEKTTGEIDCLILYQNKLFAVEIKTWKGEITEKDDVFIQKKKDKYTGEIYTKALKSPYKQLNRAIYLLKEEIKGDVFINPIVYFAGDDYKKITINENHIYFYNIEGLVNYIKNYGKETFKKEEAINFFLKCNESDYIYASNFFNKSIHCIIYNASLNFETTQSLLTRKDISEIHINHHMTYDELEIYLKDNSVRKIKIENGSIKVKSINDQISTYSFSKINYIKLGKNNI